MRPITFGPQVCTDLAAGATKEWLVADGVGGYAMGTVAGLRTRRYHGLLVVAGLTPASRMLGLAALDAVVTLRSGARVRLGCHEWAGGAIEPQGHTLLSSFALIDGVPRWRWRIGAVVIEREIAAVHGRPAVAVVHRLIAGGPVDLAVEALCTWRDAHADRSGFALATTATADGCVVEQAYRIAGPGFASAGELFQAVRYREEAARGLHDQEDLWYAGSFHAALTRPGQVAEIAAWAGDLDDPPPPAVTAVDAARARNRAVVAAAAPADSTEAALALAADAFVVRTRTGPDVVAGYPWFGAWSRDTMIAYEGLFLATGRAELGRELLRSYAATLSEGMLANTADTGSVEYNTVDGTLWFLHATGRHVATTGDTDLAAELLPALTAVIEHHLAGTRYGIVADPVTGLLTQGAPGEALTWMDARVDGVPVTARAGQAVEVNALWINGLASVGALGSAAFEPLLGRARDSFARSFRSLSGMLQDVVGDHTLRPNQLFAWSLPYAPLRPDAAVLTRIGAALLTPMGLRSQAPGSTGYHGRHRGTSAERDTAYHTGTVWPWLTGAYAGAWHRLGAEVPDVFADAEAHLTEYGLGSISETAEGDAPHAGTGCPFQAWSVAEQLRARKL
ncbi:amylo-alpha-1,6-glucosidase [Actinoplanes awajinensis]|uniref:Amylo-alpha-1,6-glucosidase n=1 Tax=Actinoplanes awajinensis subsp. mycoplanecinus TaxID=135947 RepID=A0A0X3V359_9ACTN|nr:amylo-alpha-1,6-glucosidase [Actinoplanes awajinensis]KUL39124.1 amylo-alpha-1,6-glucosidase [Actinoplanes awajinensis subsp. mycoplanecinus]